MAYINTKTGCFASGTAGRDAELAVVGEKQTSKLTFSIAVGKNDSNETVWFNCQAWRDMAEYGSTLNIVKGDRITVFGKWESNEYNGKTYHNLVAEWIDKVAKEQQSQKAPATYAEISEDVDEDDLPF